MKQIVNYISEKLHLNKDISIAETDASNFKKNDILYCKYRNEIYFFKVAKINGKEITLRNLYKDRLDNEIIPKDDSNGNWIWQDTFTVVNNKLTIYGQTLCIWEGNPIKV